ncbi:putative leucine-rich repeat-containing protein DDB_G0290503 [Ptychodera flava]|uniref:putative leucine-rich repeat-containing protein DDB_G0290503 n=1 Tax=Ptychodera flava TaxID=63121 RepID=UPI00396A4780
MAEKGDTKRGLSFLVQKFDIGTLEMKRSDHLRIELSVEHLKLYLMCREERLCIKLKPTDLTVIENCVITKWSMYVLFLQTSPEKTRQIQKLCGMDHHSGGWYDPKSKEDYERRILLILGSESLKDQRDIWKIFEAIRKGNRHRNDFTYQALDVNAANDIMVAISKAVEVVNTSAKKNNSQRRELRSKRPHEGHVESSVKHLKSGQPSQTGQSVRNDNKDSSIRLQHSMVNGLQVALADSSTNMNRLQHQVNELQREMQLVKVKYKDKISKLRADMEGSKEETEKLKKELKEALTAKEELGKSLAEQKNELEKRLAQKKTEFQEEKEALHRKFASMLSESDHNKIKLESSLKVCQDNLKEHQAKLKECQESLSECQCLEEQSRENLSKNSTSLYNLRSSVFRLFSKILPDFDREDIKLNSHLDEILNELISQHENIH